VDHIATPAAPAEALLRSFFAPRAIALIGASADPLSISARPLRMLAQHGFVGALYPVNPRHAELDGRAAYPSIASVPERVDLALVAVPARLVPGVLEECALAGVRHAVVLSSGFGEAGPEGQRLQAAIADIVARTPLRVCGPNAEGFFYPAARVCATFSPTVDPEHGYELQAPGPVAVVSQSGGLGFALLNRGRDLGLTCGAVVSTGNEVDLGWLDYVDYLLDEPSIKVVLGFVEGLRNRHRLSEVARKAARLRKPIIVAKMGRSEVGRRAAAAHTASDTGSDDEYATTFRELGILRVDDVDDLLDLAAYFSFGRLPAGRRLAVLTTSGGAGAWLADACAESGFSMPSPPPEIQSEVRSFIPAYGSVDNPVDITAQAVFGGGFERALGLLAHTDDYDAIAGVGSMAREDRFLSSLPDLRAATETSRAALLFYAYTQPSPAVVAGLGGLGIPCYPTPLRAARALAGALWYREFLEGNAL
jgi:acyl-CoA synthetase (NDP forming)